MAGLFLLIYSFEMLCWYSVLQREIIMINKVYAEYSDKNGEVYLKRLENIFDPDSNTFQKCDAFSVILKQCNNGPVSFHMETRVVYNIDDAINVYHSFINKLRNSTASRCMCTVNPHTRRECCAANCPESLGGADYWQLFRRACLHRGR